MNTNTKTEPKAAEQTVSVWIPSEGVGPFLEGALNGTSFRIPTDTVVTVPKRIAKILQESRRALLEGTRAMEAYAANGGRKLG
ncbi:MAG: hypothetical protein IJK54_00460 [Clostridia bacterium]|nr:hypothetical protein [Clostridia bacterium]